MQAVISFFFQLFSQHKVATLPWYLPAALSLHLEGLSAPRNQENKTRIFILLCARIINDC